MPGIDINDLPAKYRDQAEQKYSIQVRKKRKYNNEPVQLKSLKFDSKKEARRYVELKGMLDAGLITDLRLQQSFSLQEPYTRDDGERVGPIRYKADFTYMQDGQYIIEDVKSEITKTNPAYRMKVKMMANKGYIVTEV